MSAILGSYRLSQKRKAEKLKIKKKQQEIKKELKANQQEEPPHYQYQHPNSFEGAQPCGPIWEDGVYDDSPFSPDVVFDPEYSEWKFMYGPSEDQEKLYVVRIYRSDRILYVNGEKLQPNDYSLEEHKGGSVIKIHFRVGKFKCEIKSSLTETPNDQNQTLIFNGNRIQFEEDAFDAE